MKFNNLKKNLLLATLLFSVMGGVFAQSDASSPYSRFGFGIVKQNNANTVQQGMGGIGNALFGGSLLNTSNPAAYAAIDSLSFLFDAGFYVKTVTYHTNRMSEQGSNASFDYANLGFFITKWWKTGLGITPFSPREYESTITSSDPVSYAEKFIGEGGINEIYWANGFNIANKLYLGVNSSYLFGTIADETTIYFPDSAYMTHGRRTTSTRIGNFKFDFGAIYTIKLKNNSTLSIGATYSLPMNFNSKRNVYIRSIKSYSTTTETPIDTLVLNMGERVTIKYPQGFGVGLTYKKGDRFLVGVDFNWDNWKDFAVAGVNDSLQNSWNIAIGGSYKPKSTTVSGYMKRVTYRAGFHYDQTYLRIYDKSINKFGVTVGLGLPMPRSLSSFNLALEIGRMGTTENNLVKETYFNISMGISLHEVWFVKRKYK